SLRLEQVLANLLHNAIKYTEPGGHIELTARRDGKEAVVRVKDNGIGIPSEIIPRIFELFTQAERSLDQAQGGLGIGLTLARSLVEMHGGTIAGFSEGPGQGSEFVVRLPMLDAAERPERVVPAAAAELSVATMPRRVLLVDDNRDAAESLA